MHQGDHSAAIRPQGVPTPPELRRFKALSGAVVLQAKRPASAWVVAPWHTQRQPEAGRPTVGQPAPAIFTPQPWQATAANPYPIPPGGIAVQPPGVQGRGVPWLTAITRCSDIPTPPPPGQPGPSRTRRHPQSTA